MKITASSADEFNKIDAFVKSLPKDVCSKVTHATYNFSFNCDLAPTWESGEAIMYVPENIVVISMGEDFTRVDCTNCSFITKGKSLKIKPTK